MVWGVDGSTKALQCLPKGCSNTRAHGAACHAAIREPNSSSEADSMSDSFSSSSRVTSAYRTAWNTTGSLGSTESWASWKSCASELPDPNSVYIPTRPEMVWGIPSLRRTILSHVRSNPTLRSWLTLSSESLEDVAGELYQSVILDELPYRPYDEVVNARRIETYYDQVRYLVVRDIDMVEEWGGVDILLDIFPNVESISHSGWTLKKDYQTGGYKLSQFISVNILDDDGNVASRTMAPLRYPRIPASLHPFIKISNHVSAIWYPSQIQRPSALASPSPMRAQRIPEWLSENTGKVKLSFSSNHVANNRVLDLLLPVFRLRAARGLPPFRAFWILPTPVIFGKVAPLLETLTGVEELDLSLRYATMNSVLSAVDWTRFTALKVMRLELHYDDLTEAIVPTRSQAVSPAADGSSQEKGFPLLNYLYLKIIFHKKPPCGLGHLIDPAVIVAALARFQPCVYHVSVQYRWSDDASPHANPGPSSQELQDEVESGMTRLLHGWCYGRSQGRGARLPFRQSVTLDNVD